MPSDSAFFFLGELHLPEEEVSRIYYRLARQGMGMVTGNTEKALPLIGGRLFDSRWHSR